MTRYDLMMRQLAGDPLPPPDLTSSNDATKLMRQLAGDPLPPLPVLPGRRHRQPKPDDTDPGLLDLEHAAIWRDLTNDFSIPT